MSDFNEQKNSVINATSAFIADRKKSYNNDYDNRFDNDDVSENDNASDPSDD